jgi:epoxyqueuosine reductase
VGVVDARSAAGGGYPSEDSEIASTPPSPTLPLKGGGSRVEQAARKRADQAAGGSRAEQVEGGSAPPSAATPKSAATLKEKLRVEAKKLGFDAIGVARPEAIPEAKARLQKFLAEGAHGDMVWMAANAERRGDPRALWPQVRSVIALGLNYGPDHDPLAILQRRERGAISVYAQGDDYHELIKPRLKALARWLVAQGGGDVKVFVDTAAVMEKPLATASGLGWQGKHTNLLSRQFGSWLFLGAIFTTLDLPPDEAEPDACGTCRACLDVCPTAAFPAPYQLDARRCISYLTIEHKGPIPRELRPLMGNRIYGCDDCLAVCPWNKFAQAGRETKLASRGELRAPELAELARLDDAAYRAMFAKTALKRTGRDRFVRNVLVAIGNSGDPSLAGEAERLTGDASALVRGAAVWALGRLAPVRLAKLSDARSAETDPDVAEEWAAATSLSPLAGRGSG